MTLDRWLASVGLLIGLPGFLLLFFTERQALAILICLIAVVVLVAAFLVHRLSTLPPLTMNSAEITLEFIDGKKRARLSKAYKIRPNYSHLTMMTHKNIAADGLIENICWDGQPVPPEWVKKMLGEYVVTVHFPYARRRWREFEGTLSYDCLDSFGRNPDGMIYVVDFPTKNATIRVHFPPGHPCKTAKAFKTEGTGERPVRDPVLSDGGKHLEFTLRRPRIGSEFVIHWTW